MLTVELQEYSGQEATYTKRGLKGLKASSRRGGGNQYKHSKNCKLWHQLLTNIDHLHWLIHQPAPISIMAQQKKREIKIYIYIYITQWLDSLSPVNQLPTCSGEFRCMKYCQVWRGAAHLSSHVTELQSHWFPVDHNHHWEETYTSLVSL